MKRKKIKVAVEYFLQHFNNTWKDSLTGAYTRGFILKLVLSEITRNKRYKRSLSLVMIDLDDFKKVNDTYGHTCGDTVLREVVKILKTNIRESDMIGRFGGDEFVLLLPETELNSAVLLADKLVKLVTGTPITHSNKKISMTISVGVATVNEDVVDMQSLLKSADDALYKAKGLGKNKVCV